jgi:hypothetical protein
MWHLFSPLIAVSDLSKEIKFSFQKSLTERKKRKKETGRKKRRKKHKTKERTKGEVMKI